MSFAMVHILIADMVREYFSEIKDYPTYILGTIAPDAVHANKNYTPTLKEKSHLFTPNLIWGQIDDWNKAEEWLSNIKKYYKENQERYNHDFLLGYVVHLLADVYNSMYFYTPFMQSIKGDYEEAIKKYKEESFNINYYLFSKYSESKDVSEVLHNGKAITLEGIVEQEDIKKRIDYLLQEEFMYRDVRVSQHKICTIQGTEQLMEGAVNFIKDKSRFIYDA